MKSILIPLTIVLLFTGCAKKQDVLALQARVEALEKDLGPYRYGALNPKLQITIQQETFTNSEEEGGSPKYHIAGIANNVGDYPGISNSVEVNYILRFDKDHQDENMFYLVMDGDTAMFEEETLLIGIPDSYASIKPDIEITKVTKWPLVDASIVIQRK